MRVVLIIFSIVSVSTFAAQPASVPSLSVELDVPRHLVKQLPGIISSAVNFVRAFPPTGFDNHLFDWKADRKILTGKSVRIILATSHSKILAPILNNNRDVINLDAFTMAPVNQAAGTMPIMIVLLVDRIFYDGRGREHKDAFPKAIVALAHEIYGNVQKLLEQDIAQMKAMTSFERQRQEMNAFETSIRFLLGLKSHALFQNLPPNIREGLMRLLPLEVMGLRSWQRAHPLMQLDPGCVAMLDAIKNKSR